AGGVAELRERRHRVEPARRLERRQEARYPVPRRDRRGGGAEAGRERDEGSARCPEEDRRELDELAVEPPARAPCEGSGRAPLGGRLPLVREPPCSPRRRSPPLRRLRQRVEQEVIAPHGRAVEADALPRPVGAVEQDAVAVAAVQA